MTKFALILLAVPFAVSVGAHDVGNPPDKEIPVDKLKAIFLDCDRMSATTMLDASSAAVCSIAYEQLLKRGFAGDFNRLMDWWRVNKRRS